MNKYEELANTIIDRVSDVVMEQHPEIKLKTKYAKMSDVDSPALIVGVGYYDLECEIATEIKKLIRRKK